MTEDHLKSQQLTQAASRSTPLEERWRRLEPGEQLLATMALDALNSGEFESRRAWGQFVDAAIELRPALAAGALSVEDVHGLALEALRSDVSR